MQLLIAHGDDASRLALMRAVEDLVDDDLELIESADGLDTLEMLLATDHPVLAVVDWDLPRCDGPELCRLVRAYRDVGPPYVIVLARGDYRLAEGLEAGADDCIHTPANGDELRARINVGRRFAELPWDKLLRAEAASTDEVGGQVVSLAAQRSMNGDDLAGDGAHAGSRGNFELQSVLVAQ